MSANRATEGGEWEASGVGEVVRKYRGRLREAMGEEEEWNSGAPVMVRDLGEGAVGRRWLTTKGEFLAEVLDWRSTGGGIRLVGQHGLPGDSQVELVCEIMGKGTGQAVFVGDLDPLDLTMWMMWRELLGGKGVELVNGSVVLARKVMEDEGWEEHWSIEMSEAEVRLVGMEGEWRGLVDPGIVKMIDGGRKLEMEGLFGWFGGEGRVVEGLLGGVR